MSLYIQGIGWASPLAQNVSDLLNVLKQQTISPNRNILSSEIRNRARLRRSGRISQYAWMAVQDAITDSGKEWNQEEANRTGLIFVSTHGGICHTIRFFENIATEGTAAGSPIFFPETVYNAPPSHIAAELGINGIVTSFVGDSAAVGEAFCTAEEWINSGICEQCMLVASEETHYLLEKAYSHLYLKSSKSNMFLDGAATILLSKHPKGASVRAHPEVVIRKSTNLLPTLRDLFKATAADRLPDIILTSATSSSLKAAEYAAITELWPTTVCFNPKSQLKESFSASGLGNVVIAEGFLREGKYTAVLISLLGTNGQASAIIAEKI